MLELKDFGRNLERQIANMYEDEPERFKLKIADIERDLKRQEENI